jgi:hypothetical protein
MFSLLSLVGLVEVVMSLFYPPLKKSKHDATYAEIGKKKLDVAALTVFSPKQNLTSIL